MLELSRTADAVVQGCCRFAHSLYATPTVSREYSSLQHWPERHPLPNLSDVPCRKGSVL